MNNDDRLQLSSVASVLFHQTVTFFNTKMWDENITEEEVLDATKAVFLEKLEEAKRIIQCARKKGSDDN